MLARPSILSRLTRGRSASFTPFAARTQQYVKEQLGQADDKVRYPRSVLRMRVADEQRGRPSCLRTTSSSRSESMP